MREKITKFDLNDAFKALDEIDVPKVKGLRPKQLDEDLRPKKVDRFKALFEEYYDIQNQQEIDEAREAREEEIAQAKLARIEKIVDLDADSPEDIQPSYVGKIIIQCPQCMTMFYKDESDIERPEDDETIVNVGEVCQHCGNEDGYTLIGKVALDEPQEEHEEEATEEQAEEAPAEEEPKEEESSENEEKEPELPSLDDLDLGKEESEENEEEKKEEAFDAGNGKVLTESAEEDLDKALEAHNEYIEYLRKELDAAEKELSKAKNNFIKNSVQAKVDALKADLEKALPEDVKEKATENELPNADELPEEAVEEKEEVKESLNEDAKHDLQAFIDSLEEKCEKCDECNEDLESENKIEDYIEGLPEACEKCKKEKIKEDVSDAEFEAMLKNPIYNEGLEEENELDEVEDFVEESFNKQATNYLTEVYENVESFETTNCALQENKLIVEGNINFKSGKIKPTKFVFENVENKLLGSNKDLSEDVNVFTLNYKIKNKALVTESLKYAYRIETTLVENLNK